MKVAVIGGTGMLGRPMVEKLVGEGFGVRVLSRDPERAASIFGADLEYGVADVTDRDSLERAFKGCDAVHVNLNPDRGADLDSVACKGLENVGLAAKASGLKTISMISGDWLPDEDHPAPRRRAFSRGILAMQQCDVPVLIWGSTWFYESLEYFVMKDRALMVGMQPLTWHFVAADDYTSWVARALAQHWEEHHRFTVHGPEGMKMFDALKKYCAAVYPKLPVQQMSITETKEFAAANPEFSWLGGFADFMATFETNGETGDAQETYARFGIPRWTLDKWAGTFSPRGE